MGEMCYTAVSATEIAQCVQAEDRGVCVCVRERVYNREDVYVSVLGTGKEYVGLWICVALGVDIFVT